MANVYILRHGDEDLFKVGMTRGEVDARMKTLVTGNPHGLSLYDSIETQYPSKVEAYLQGLLASKRSRRSEATEFYAVGPAELDSAIQEARRFNEEDLPRLLEVEQLAAERCTEEIVTPSDEDWATYQDLLVARQAHAAAEHAKNRLEWRLKLTIGAASALDGVATWRTQSRRSLDTDHFKEAHPELYETYLRETYSRTFKLL